MTLEEMTEKYGSFITILARSELYKRELDKCIDDDKFEIDEDNYDFELDQDVLKSIQILCPRLVKSYKKL